MPCLTGSDGVDVAASHHGDLNWIEVIQRFFDALQSHDDTVRSFHNKDLTVFLEMLFDLSHRLKLPLPEL